MADESQTPVVDPAVRIQELENELKELRTKFVRRRLPETRQAITHKFDIAGHEGYITVGLFEDGTPSELFITMAKEGSTIGGLMDTIGTLVSVALQYGIPLDILVRKFAHQRFEPSGFTKNPDIPIAKSITDYLFRWLGCRFIPGFKETGKRGPVQQVLPNLETVEAKPKVDAPVVTDMGGAGESKPIPASMAQETFSKKL